MGGKQRIDISVIEGKRSRPLILFVHGLGMDKCIWTSPEESKMLAGRYPLTLLMGQREHAKVVSHKPRLSKKISTGIPPKRLVTLFDRFREMGYSVIAWSQKRPASYAHIAVNELKRILEDYSGLTKQGIILVGHSRGGLIATSYALQTPEKIKAVVSIASPFKGSSLARWADIISKTLFVVNPFFQNADKGTMKDSIKQVLDFINSTAVKELLPGSDFLSSLAAPLPSKISTLNISGTSPTLLRLYRWNIDRTDTEHNRYKAVPRQLFSFPDSIKKLFPDRMVPEELKKGRGDGLVSRGSALAHNPTDYGSYPFNHAALLFAKEVQDKTIEFVSSL